MGTLTLANGTTNALAINSGVCKLSFAGLSGTGTLAIRGTLGATTLRFPNGLPAEQLKLITINGKKVRVEAQGYVLELRKGTMTRIF